MPADNKLGRFITSPAFFARAADAVEEAVADLEARGFTPAYDKPKSEAVAPDSGVVVKISVGEPSARRKTYTPA